jgi:hypothetical protein
MRHFTPETENVKIYDINKKYDLMAAIIFCFSSITRLKQDATGYI